MFEEEKYKKSDIEAYELPEDADEIFAEMHKDEFDVDMYFNDAPVKLLILESMEIITLPMSSWLALQDYNFNWCVENFEVIQ
jgi:hypothetical protein